MPHHTNKDPYKKVSVSLNVTRRSSTTSVSDPKRRCGKPPMVHWVGSTYPNNDQAIIIQFLHKLLLCTCFTTASCSIFWNFRRSTKPAITSEGTTSKSRKKSDKSLAMSAKEFWKQENNFEFQAKQIWIIITVTCNPCLKW